MGTTQLAKDFEKGPLPQHVHGLFAKLRFLPSHYIKTFEEMTQYGFIEGYQSSYFAPTTCPKTRFIVYQVEDVDMPLQGLHYWPRNLK